MKILRTLSSISTALLFSATVAAKTGYDFSPIDRYVDQAKKDIGLPSGTAIAVVKDGKIIYEGYFGYANIKEEKKVTNETAFYIASITKSIFALSTLLMEHKGDINDTTTMKEMFPTLKFTHIKEEDIQLQDLLSCSAGVINAPFVDILAYNGNHDRAHRRKLIAQSRKNERAPLGEFEYTNVGFNIASVWVEDYYKKDWQEVLANLVYEPLKMKHTSSYMSDAKKKGFEVARPYALDRKAPAKIYPFEKSDSTMHAAGGTITTASDLARYLIAQLNDGKVDGQQVFPAEVIKKSQQQIVNANDQFRDFLRTGYAWGWYVGPYKDETMTHHFGGITGTHAHASFIKKHNIGLVVLNNEASMSSKLTNAIADIAYGILLNKGNPEDVATKHTDDMKKTWARMQVKLQKWMDSDAKRDRERTMVLSQEKNKYAGVFHNPIWGDLNVELLSFNNFKFTLGKQAAIATAYTKPDTMRIQFPARGGVVATYEIDNGEVVSVKLYEERFTKKTNPLKNAQK